MSRRMRRSLPLWESIYIELDITKQAIRMDGLWLIKKIYTGILCRPVIHSCGQWKSSATSLSSTGRL